MPGTTSKNKRRLWIAGGLLLAALTVLLLLPGDRKDSRVAVNDGTGTIWITPIADLPVNSFARSDFIQDDAGTAYTGGAYTASQGVDVSEWQKEIQWQEVAAGGIDFAVLRCGFRRYVSGNLEKDASFEANYAGAGEAGLRRGVYFFSQAITPEEARAEAAYVLEMLDGRPLELPVFYDWETVEDEEGRANGLDGETVTACAAAFCRAIQAGGYRAGVYFNLQMGYHTYGLEQVRDWVWWLGEPGQHPSFYYETQLWQYDHGGTVPGISGAVDRNLLFEAAEKAG